MLLLQLGRSHLVSRYPKMVTRFRVQAVNRFSPLPRRDFSKSPTTVRVLLINTKTKVYLSPAITMLLTLTHRHPMKPSASFVTKLSHQNGFTESMSRHAGSMTILMLRL